MADDWTQTTFAELVASKALLIGDGYRAKNEELGGTGPVFLRGGLIQEDRIHFEKAERFHEHLLPKLQQKLTQPYDVVVTTKGWSTGRTCFFLPDYPQSVYSPHLSFWRSLDRTRLDPQFLRQWSRSPPFVRQLESLGGTCTLHPYLNLRAQYQLEIELPPIEEQRRIAAVLGALDDKIELNRKMSRTLEEMAQALFKSWFIDFDGHEDLVDGKLGPIPRGWSVQPLSACTSYLRRGLSPSYTEEAGVMVLNQRCIRDFRVNTGPARLHDTSKRSIDRFLLEPDDILVNSTGVGTLGRVAQLPDFGFPVVCDSHVTVVRASAEIDKLFLGGYLIHLQPVIESLGQGSTGQTELSRDSLGRLLLAIPPADVQARFADLVRPLRSKMFLNEKESDTLSALRDLLLPKLISGELRVPESLPLP